MTKERIVKELSKVREQLAGLQARERDLAEQLQMAEDAEKMKFIEKNKISLDRLILLNKVSEEEIMRLLKEKSRKKQHNQKKGRLTAMKNRKLSSKAVISLILSAVLFTMPAVAFSVNGNYAISAFAEETKETEESKPEESTEQTPGESETDVSTEENTENSTEGSIGRNYGGQHGGKHRRRHRREYRRQYR